MPSMTFIPDQPHWSIQERMISQKQENYVFGVPYLAIVYSGGEGGPIRSQMDQLVDSVEKLRFCWRICVYFDLPTKTKASKLKIY